MWVKLEGGRKIKTANRVVGLRLGLFELVLVVNTCFVGSLKVPLWALLPVSKKALKGSSDNLQNPKTDKRGYVHVACKRRSPRGFEGLGFAHRGNCRRLLLSCLLQPFVINTSVSNIESEYGWFFKEKKRIFGIMVLNAQHDFRFIFFSKTW